MGLHSVMVLVRILCLVNVFHVVSGDVKAGGRDIVQAVKCDASSMHVTIKTATPSNVVEVWNNKWLEVTKCDDTVCSFTVSNLTNVTTTYGAGRVGFTYYVKNDFRLFSANNRTTEFEAQCYYTFSSQAPSKDVSYVTAKDHFNHTLTSPNDTDIRGGVTEGDWLTLSVFSTTSAIYDMIPYSCYLTLSPRRPTSNDLYQFIGNQCPYTPQSRHEILFQAAAFNDSQVTFVVCELAFCLFFNAEECGHKCVSNSTTPPNLVRAWQVLDEIIVHPRPTTLPSTTITTPGNNTESTGNDTSTTRPSPPHTSTRGPRNVCSGRGRCQCDSGYTGADCGKPLDWCQQQTIEINGKPKVQSICGDRGTCVSTPAGASCICKSGFTGRFCDQLIPDSRHLSSRCIAYKYHSNTTSSNVPSIDTHWAPQDQVGCKFGQECVPDDLQCLLTPCEDPAGWCLPNDRARRDSHGRRNFKVAPRTLEMQGNFWGNDSDDVCSGHGQCQCDHGYTGRDCEKEIDWCNLPAQGFNSSSPLSNICGPNSTCISHPSGATCICQPGFTGPFCNEPIHNEAMISRRCFAYAPYRRNLSVENISIPIGCGTGMACVPDNLQCLLAHCRNPIGWCLPLLEVDQVRFNRLMTRFALVG